MEDRDVDIRNLAASGQMIQAIKVYRERYGVGLACAKAAVEAMVQAAYGEAGAAAARDSDEANFRAQLGAYIRANQKIQAIRLYRQQYRANLSQAKDAMDRWAIQIGAPAFSSGPSGAGLLGSLLEWFTDRRR